MGEVVGSSPAVDWFETIASAITDQMAYIDRDGVFRAVNRAYLEATAVRLERADLQLQDLLGRNIEDVLPAALIEEVLRPNLTRCLAGHTTSLQRWFTIAGESRYVHARYHPHRDADGQVLGTVVVLRDRTRARRSQLRLNELANSVPLLSGDLDGVAQELVELATDSLELPSATVWELDLEPPQLRRLTSVNRRQGVAAQPPILALEEYPRFMQALAEGSPIDAHEALIDPRLRELADAWLRPREVISVLVAPVMVGGDLTAVLWLEGGPDLRIWQASDVAFVNEAAGLLSHATIYRQRHQLEQRLVEGQKREGLGVLAGGLAHDFNNLLVGILGGADLLHQQMAEQPAVRKRLELIRSAARRASDLCSQMLAYAGKGRFQSSLADLSELTEGTVKLLRSTIPDNVEIRLELSEDLPQIEVDLTQIRQVVMNLLLNAAEALEEDSGEVVARTEEVTLGGGNRVSWSFGGPGYIGGPPAAGDYVRLRVTDNGCGMSESTLEKIFDPFFTTKFTGRGLGLAAVLGIVRGHQGGIRIETAEGRGSTIEVLFPVATRDSVTSEGRQAAPDMAPRAVVGQPRVLVVDDEEVVRLIAAEMLDFLDCEVFLAQGGFEALEIFEQRGESLDLVVLDVTMPEMSGEEVLIKLRAARPDLPVVIASGFTKEDLSRRFAAHDIAGFIHKPYKLDELKELIDQALGSAT